MTQNELLQLDTSVENLAAVKTRIARLGSLGVLSAEQTAGLERLQLVEAIIEISIESQEPHYHHSRKFAA